MKDEGIRMKNTVATETAALNNSQGNLHELVRDCSALEAGCTTCRQPALLGLCLRAAVEAKP